MGNPHPQINGPQIIAIAKQLGETFAARVEIIDHQAKVLRTRYNALVERGFNEHQALYLCHQNWNETI